VGLPSTSADSLRPYLVTPIQPWIDLYWDPISTAIQAHEKSRLLCFVFRSIKPIPDSNPTPRIFFTTQSLWIRSTPRWLEKKNPSSEAKDELRWCDGDTSFFPPSAAIDSVSNLLSGSLGFMHVGKVIVPSVVVEVLHQRVAAGHGHEAEGALNEGPRGISRTGDEVAVARGGFSRV
jgi:hypothetical protein